MSSLQIEHWGITEYEEAFARQKETLTKRIAGEISDTLVLTEHWPVFTVGSRIGAEKNFLGNPSTSQIPVVKTNRGGDITYHGPGQIVGYLFIDLQQLDKDLHRLLRNIEELIIRTIGCFGLATHRREGKTGIWLEERKIAAIGVAAKQWVSYHGFSLNVNTNLQPFGQIIPCGISNEEGSVTSLEKELQEEITIDQVLPVIEKEIDVLLR